MVGISEAFPGWAPVARIGAGSFGEVWRVEPESGDAARAVKLVRYPHDPGEVEDLVAAGYDAASLRERFEEEERAARREALALERLAGCDRVVRTHGHEVLPPEGGGPGFRLYIMMDLLEPLTSAVAREGAPDQRAAALVGADVCGALAQCHALGIMHRDVKPANVFLGPSGRLLLGDFGLARPDSWGSASTKSVGVGTPTYMAPEVARGGRYGQSADVYSAGAMLYRWLNGGRPPFVGPHDPRSREGDEAAERRRLSGERPPAPAGEGVDPGLAAAVLSAVDPDPSARPSAAELSGLLSGWLGAAGGPSGWGSGTPVPAIYRQEPYEPSGPASQRTWDAADAAARARAAAEAAAREEEERDARREADEAARREEEEDAQREADEREARRREREAAEAEEARARREAEAAGKPKEAPVGQKEKPTHTLLKRIAIIFIGTLIGRLLAEYVVLPSYQDGSSAQSDQSGYGEERYDFDSPSYEDLYADGDAITDVTDSEWLAADDWDAQQGGATTASNSTVNVEDDSVEEIIASQIHDYDPATGYSYALSHMLDASGDTKYYLFGGTVRVHNDYNWSSTSAGSDNPNEVSVVSVVLDKPMAFNEAQAYEIELCNSIEDSGDDFDAYANLEGHVLIFASSVFYIPTITPEGTNEHGVDAIASHPYVVADDVLAPLAPESELRKLWYCNLPQSYLYADSQ